MSCLLERGRGWTQNKGMRWVIFSDGWKERGKEEKKDRLEGGRRGCSRVGDERRDIWRGERRTMAL